MLSKLTVCYGKSPSLIGMLRMLNYQRVFSIANLLTSRQKICAKNMGIQPPRGDSPIALVGLLRANLDHLLKAHGWFKTSRHVKSMYGLMGKLFIGLLEDKIYRIESIFFAHENWAFLQHPKQSHTSAI